MLLDEIIKDGSLIISSSGISILKSYSHKLCIYEPSLSLYDLLLFNENNNKLLNNFKSIFAIVNASTNKRDRLYIADLHDINIPITGSYYAVEHKESLTAL